MYDKISFQILDLKDPEKKVKRIREFSNKLWKIKLI